MSVTKSDDLHRVNAAAVALLQEFARGERAAGLVFIAGVMGQRHDGYDPRNPLDAGESRRYHSAQAACQHDPPHRRRDDAAPLDYLIGCVHPTTFRAARQRHRALPA